MLVRTDAGRSAGGDDDDGAAERQLRLRPWQPQAAAAAVAVVGCH